MTSNGDRSAGESRRSFIRKGALTSGGLALGTRSIDRVAAQATRTPTADDDESDEGSEPRTGLMFNHEYHPGAQFGVVSPPIQELPDLTDGEGTGGEEVDRVLDGYQLRMVEYVNTGERAQLFLGEDVGVEQGKVYELARIFSVFPSAPAKGLVSVEFDPVPDRNVLLDEDPNPGWEPGRDFDLVEGGGTALISGYRFYPGALFRIDTGVIEWIPRENVRRAVDSVAYNTRLAEYLGTNMNFVFYTTDDFQPEIDAVYVMRDDAEMVDPPGRLYTIQFSRVDEDDLAEGFLPS